MLQFRNLLFWYTIVLSSLHFLEALKRFASSHVDNVAYEMPQLLGKKTQSDLEHKE